MVTRPFCGGDVRVLAVIGEPLAKAHSKVGAIVIFINKINYLYV
jgi:hypothetical protein